jgi:isochorismate synthase EntC
MWGRIIFCRPSWFSPPQLYENYPTAYIFAIQRGKRYFVGATPERLICGVNGQIQTMALPARR